MDILEKIIKHKKKEIGKKKKSQPQEILEETAEMLADQHEISNTFYRAFTKENMAFICEVKKASPSKGIIRKNFNHVEIAKAYAANGAGAISVLTDEKFFKGKLKYLSDISENVDVPLLRKDFIIDDYQIYEAVLFGADAILLIAAVMDEKKLKSLYHTACRFNLGVLLEIHDEQDLNKALNVDAHLIGINNRNLKTFKTDLKTTEDLIKKIPENKVVVSESGINHAQDVKRVFDAGARGVLIGEALMREKDVGAKLKQLKNFK